MHSNWINALKTFSIISFLLLLNTKYLARAEQVSNEETDDAANNLQTPEADEASLAKRGWKQLQSSWGKRNIDDEQFRRLSQNGEYPESSNSFDYDPSRYRDYRLISDMDDFDDSIGLEKRAWNSINGAWGKRNWNQLRGNGWGKKREPSSWNNLRGLWGKRSGPQSWNRLSSAWGK